AANLESNKEVRKLVGAYIEGKVNGWRIARDWMNLGLSAFLPAEAATAGGSRAFAYGVLGSMERAATASKKFSKEEWAREIAGRRERYQNFLEKIKEEELKPEVERKSRRKLWEEAQGEARKKERGRVGYVLNDVVNVARKEWWRAMRFQGKVEGREERKWVDAVQAYAAAVRALGLGGHALHSFLQGMEAGSAGTSFLEVLQHKFEGNSDEVAGNVIQDLFVKNPKRALLAYPRMIGGGLRWITHWGEEELVSAAEGGMAGELISKTEFQAQKSAVEGFLRAKNPEALKLIEISPEGKITVRGYPDVQAKFEDSGDIVVWDLRHDKTRGMPQPRIMHPGDVAFRPMTESEAKARIPEISTSAPTEGATTSIITEKHLELGKVRKGEGVWQAVRRQIEASPVEWGFTGRDASDTKAVHAWANRETWNILTRDEYIKDGLETGVRYDPEHSVSYVLEKDTDDTTHVAEYIEGEWQGDESTGKLDEYEYNRWKPKPEGASVATSSEEKPEELHAQEGERPQGEKPKLMTEEDLRAARARDNEHEFQGTLKQFDKIMEESRGAQAEDIKGLDELVEQYENDAKPTASIADHSDDHGRDDENIVEEKPKPPVTQETGESLEYKRFGRMTVAQFNKESADKIRADITFIENSKTPEAEKKTLIEGLNAILKVRETIDEKVTNILEHIRQNNKLLWDSGTLADKTVEELIREHGAQVVPEEPIPYVEAAQAAKFEVDASIPGLAEKGIKIGIGAIGETTTIREVLNPKFSNSPNASIVKGRGDLRKLVHDLVFNKERTSQEQQELLNRPAKGFLIENLQEPQARTGEKQTVGEDASDVPEAPQQRTQSGAEMAAGATEILKEGKEAFHAGVWRLMEQDNREWFDSRVQIFDDKFNKKQTSIEKMEEIVGGFGQVHDPEKSRGENMAGAIMRDLDARVQNGTIKDIPRELVGEYKIFVGALADWAEKARDMNDASKKISPEAAAEIIRYRDIIQGLESAEVTGLPAQTATTATVAENVLAGEAPPSSKMPEVPEIGGGRELVGKTGATHVVFSKEPNGGISLNIMEGFSLGVGKMQLQDIDQKWGDKVLAHLQQKYNDGTAMDRFATARDRIVPMQVANMMTFKDILKSSHVTAEERAAIERQIVIIENGLVRQYGDVFKGIGEKIGKTTGLKKE
ncbi:MAG: hypothetical protein Q8R20_01460, partial [Nanoarchaeota archaeon]|nr:hypothetical protein [Nanoarchaeota archaeon]